jgi:hypothetical protein
MINKNYYYFGIILVITTILFYKPLLSEEPLGLDAMGHLSKVAYIKEFSFANWDMSWYSGAPFLKLYAPLFYYVIAIFPNPIKAINIFSFFSIFFSCIGIYLVTNYYTKNQKISFLASLSFLTVLSISFYYVSVGNHPWISALWTIPFSLYFLELFLDKKEKKYYVFFCITFALSVLIHVAMGFIVGLSMIIIIFRNGFTKRSLKHAIFCAVVPLLIVSFWFLPFLSYKNNFFVGFKGQTPLFSEVIGFNNYITWGNYSGGIGILFILFIISLLFFNRFYKDRRIISILIVILAIGFIFFGGMGRRYPYGVEPVRFVLPLSIFIAIFCGMVFSRLGFKMQYFFVSLIFIGLIWNFFVIDNNFEEFSYHGEGSRYYTFRYIIKDEKFPLVNEFGNYRFGTSKYIFGENINFYFPSVSQTFGYQDAGMLNPPRFYDMRWHIWLSPDIDGAVYWLDWFGIRYFEIEHGEEIEKFETDERFEKIIVDDYDNYKFSLFEYKDAKGIISLVDFYNGTHIGREKQLVAIRNHPDKIIIGYEFNEGDAIIFKEFYHESWNAKDIETGNNIEIMKTDTGMMAVYPKSNATIFYQKRTILEFAGIIFSILGIVFLFFVRKIAIKF